MLAIAEAAFVELLLAVRCLLLACSAERRLRLQLRNAHTGLPRMRLVAEQTTAEVIDHSERLRT